MIVDLYKSGMTLAELIYIFTAKKIKGCLYDNACIESFHAALKKEEVYTIKYSDYNSAKIAIFKYIESWYNTRRIHSAINYMTPNECERLARRKFV